jgi:beta-fructofuranosidase
MTADLVEPDGAHRPVLHFTPPAHWLNDPHGICWVGDEYHLFYQLNPAGRAWGPVVHWGHAVGPDLVRWRHRPIALSPGAHEQGCWTGAVVVEDGTPMIYYTSVPHGNYDDGRVAVARPDADLVRWQSGPGDIVVAGPPFELGATIFRDPCIVAFEGGWRMVVGVGVGTDGGLAIQYRSDDLRTWSYDGVVCARSGAETEGAWTGGMWECPQLFRVGDDWVLAVSVWDSGLLHYVAGAVGSYDGHTFVPKRWTRLTHDALSYAMTSFSDRDGRPCVMFWTREEPGHDPSSRPWSGALSLPMVVSVDDGDIRLSPHPDVDALRTAGDEAVGMAALPFRSDAPVGLDLQLSGGGRLRLSGDAGAALDLSSDPAAGVLSTSSGPVTPQTIPLGAGGVRVIVDDGIVAVFAGGNYGAVRYEFVPKTLEITGDPAALVDVGRLDPS